MLAFQPLEPKYTAGHRLQSIRIHVRDHRLRVLAVADRTLEAYYGAFVFSQARKGRKEARHLALAVSYGPEGRDAQLAGFESRIYELGTEPPSDDIDGRTPSVVTWSDGAMFYLIASDRMPSADLVRIADSMYE